MKWLGQTENVSAKTFTAKRISESSSDFVKKTSIKVSLSWTQ